MNAQTTRRFTGGRIVALALIVPEGLFALFTTLLRAAVGSNLLLLALDLAWAPQVGTHSFETTRMPGLAGLRTQEDPS